jgi:hypothetical protein
MNRPITTFLLALAGTALVQVATARADEPFDTTGWVKLGEQTVDGSHDEDTLRVGRDEGRFTKLMFVVLDDDLYLADVTVTFGNGETFSPETRHYFREGQRTRAIDLPGEARGIRSITLAYGDLDEDRGDRGDRDRGDRRRGRRYVREGAQPTVEVWGLEAARSSDWSDDGWDLLATRRITNRRGTITLRAPRRAGPYDHLSVVVTEGRLRITNVSVRYAKGKRGRHRLDQDFDQTWRHRQLDLTGQPREIRSITISYVNLGGRRSPATLEVWGRLGLEPAFDSEGWTMLGEQSVDGRRDRDVVPIGRDDGTFRELAFVVVGAPVEMRDIVVHMARGNDFEIDLAQLFPEGRRWGRVDLPGRRAAIDEIELRYGARRGGGRATVQIWAR